MTESVTMHLLWITENYPPSPGGMAVSCDRIVRGLREAGATVDVLHLSRNLSRIREEIQQGGRYFGWPLGDDPSHALNLLFERMAIDPKRPRFTHVVAFGGNHPIVAGPVFSAWLELPLVTLLRGNDFDAAIFSAQRAGSLRESIGRSAAICTVSGDKKRRIDAMFPGAPTYWTPNGIDLDDWSPLPSDREAASSWRTTEVDPRKRVLGLFGQIKPKKGGTHLLESLTNSGIADRIHLLLVGDLDPTIEARLTAQPAPVAHTALPFGDRYALLRHCGACDAVAIPSYYDGTPNVLLEAMGLGVPLVASTAGGMGDLLEAGVHGFLFAPGDPDGCRDALTRFVHATPDTLARMGAACLERAREFTPQRETRAYLDVLRSTAELHPLQSGNAFPS